MRFSSLRTTIGIGCAVLGLAGTALVATAPAARAQNSVMFNFTPTVPLTTTEINQLFTTSKFDGSLGTLVGIRLTFTGTINTNITVTNNAASTSTGNVRTEVDLTLVDPNNLFPLDGQSPPQGTGDAFDPSQNVNLLGFLSPRYDYSLDPSQTKMSGLLSSTSTRSGDINGGTVGNFSDIAAEFTGNAGDTINVTGRTKTSTVLTNNAGNTSSSQMTQASLSGTITYYYTPEPGTLSLLGTGLVMGGATVGSQIRRRRRKA